MTYDKIFRIIIFVIVIKMMNISVTYANIFN